MSTINDKQSKITLQGENIDLNTSVNTIVSSGESGERFTAQLNNIV